MMDRLIPFSLILLAHRVLAQDITTLESSLPQCAATCVQEGIAITGCDPSNFACHCANYNTMASIVGPCLQQTQACTPDVLTTMYTTINQICAYYGELPASIAAPPTPETIITTPVEPAPAATPSSATAAFPSLPPDSWLVSLPPGPSTPAALPQVGSYLPTGAPPAPSAPSAPAPINAIPSAPGGAPGAAPLVSPTLTTLAPSWDPVTGLEVTPVAAALVQKGKTTLSVITSATPTGGFSQGGDGVIGAAERGRGVSTVLAVVMVLVGLSVCYV